MSSGEIAAVPTPSIHARTRSGMRIPLRPAQKCDSPDRQPLGYEDVAVVQKDSIMRRDECSGSKLRARLAAARTHFAILSLSIAQLRNHLELAIENTYLTIQIGAHHPLTLGLKIARHSQVRLVLNRPQMNAVKCESLDAAVSAVSHNEHWRRSPWVHPLSMWVVQLTIAVSGLADLPEEFSGKRKPQHVVRAVAIAHVKITIQSECDIRGHEVDRPLHIVRVFSGIAMHPCYFACERGFYHLATVDVAMVEEFCFPLAAQLQSVRSTSELLAKGTNEAAFLVEDNDRLAAHTRFVHSVPNIDVSLLILAKSVGVSPHQPFWRDQPVVDTLVSMRAGTKHGRARA